MQWYLSLLQITDTPSEQIWVSISPTLTFTSLTELRQCWVSWQGLSTREELKSKLLKRSVTSNCLFHSLFFAFFPLIWCTTISHILKKGHNERFIFSVLWQNFKACESCWLPAEHQNQTKGWPFVESGSSVYKPFVIEHTVKKKEGCPDILWASRNLPVCVYLATDVHTMKASPFN